MRALMLLSLLLGFAGAVCVGTDAAEYVRAVTFFVLTGVYSAVVWPAFRAHPEQH
jgi:hypothetical protein